jgi:hypothetical protein
LFLLLISLLYAQNPKELIRELRPTEFDGCIEYVTHLALEFYDFLLVGRVGGFLFLQFFLDEYDFLKLLLDICIPCFV